MYERQQQGLPQLLLARDFRFLEERGSTPLRDAMVGAGSSSSGPEVPDFRSASVVFRGLEHLSDDDLRVCLRVAGIEQARRVLGLGHHVLIGVCGHYRARITAKDAALTWARENMAAQGVLPAQPPSTLSSQTLRAAKP